MSLTKLNPAGLYTSPSALSSVPEGALLKADNVVLGRPGLLETRRGLERLAGAFPDAGGVKSWVSFGGGIVGWGGGVLASLDTTTGLWTAYSGTYAVPSGASRVQFAESANCLFFTTSTGVFRLDTLTSTPVPAGVPQALDGTVTIVSNGAAATGTVTLTGSAGNPTVTIGGTAVGPVAYAGSDAATATATAAAINANATVAALVTATALSNVITITSDSWGTSGNSITLTATRSAGLATASGATLTGGVDASGQVLAPSTSAAYRYVWGTRDAHNRLLLGAPSGRVIASNASGGTGDVSHVIPIPDGITTSFFLQVYRSASAALNDSPSDEMRQVLEVFPTDTDITNKSITVTDVDPIRAGPTLYTSPNMGDGILAAKYVPPLCTAIAEWQGRLWCAETAQRQRLTLTLLSVDAASGGMDDGDGFLIGFDLLTSEEYRASTVENPLTGEFQRYTDGSPAQNIANTARSMVRVINASSPDFQATYASGDADVQVKIIIEARDLSAPQFIVAGTYGGPYWAPAVPWYIATTQITRVGTTVTATALDDHSFTPGMKVTLLQFYSPDFPTGTKTITSVPTPNTFTYEEAGAATTVVANRTWRYESPEIRSDAEDAPNGFAYSPPGEPDAVPLPDYEVVGNADKRVLAILPLSNALFLLKEDGLYRVTGDSPETLVIEPWDSTVRFIAPDAVTVIDGQAFALADEGLVTWTESSRPRPASVPIESALRFLAETAPGVVRNTAFIAPYDSDRRLLLWMPASDASTSAEQAFVLNLLTNTWTRWTVPAVTALVNPEDGKLYVTPPTGNTQRERKTGTSADYQGPDGEAISVDVQWVAENAGAPHMGKLWGIVEYFFANAVPSAATAYFSTEVVPATQSTPTYANNGSRPGVVEAVVTPNHARAAGLSIGFQHAVAQEKVELQGYGIRFRMYQGRR